ncbi:hypothetical protein KAR91_85895 [Candidatus Pacearchaeota archaeon]|nr:hypothetical protein [Candidatus Pacearchaeota archaeon]
MGTLDERWKSQYFETVTELAGNQFKPRLVQYMRIAGEKGDEAWFDAAAPLDFASDIIMTNNMGIWRKELPANPTTDEFQATFTPHTEIDKERTLCSPHLIEAGYYFRKSDNIGEVGNPESYTLKQIMRRMARAKDIRILDAMTGLTAFRGKNQADGAPVNFPTTQVLSITAGVSTFSKDTLTQVQQIFEENYIDSEDIYMVITPEMKAILVTNSNDTIFNSRFVDNKNGMLFEEYILPTIYGVTLIIHPLMSEYNTSVLGEHADGIAVAFTKEWGWLNEFWPMEVDIELAILQRNSPVLYIDNWCNAVRVDDSRVVIVGFGAVS